LRALNSEKYDIAMQSDITGFCLFIQTDTHMNIKGAD